MKNFFLIFFFLPFTMYSQIYTSKYTSLVACQAVCGTPTPSWDCGAAGCYDPGTGNGQYTTRDACQAVCVSTIPGGISTGPTNPPPAPPISYVIDIYFLNTSTFFNSLGFISSSVRDDLDSYDYRREILITPKNVL